MITFRIGFLFAFSAAKVQKGETGRKGKKGKEEKKSKKQTKKSKGSKSSKVEVEKKPRVVKEEPPKPEYVLEVGNPLGYVHVEYDLIPNRERQQFDVVCWKGVAKIFSQEGEIVYRVRVIDDKVWVPVFVNHYTNTLVTEELLKLHQHVIDFHISTNKNKISQKAKSENTKVFYLKEVDVSVDELVPVFTENPNLLETKEKSSATLLNEFMENLIVGCIYRPGQKNRNEIVTKFSWGDVTHLHWMDKIMKQTEAQHFFFKEYIPIPPPPMTLDDILESDKAEQPGKKHEKHDKKEVAKKSQKKKPKGDKTPKKSSEMVVKVSAEIFFTDPSLAMYDVQNTNDVVTNGYVLLSVDKLMTRQQKYNLNPLILKIDKIDDLDVEKLKKAKFKSVFVRYNIPFVAQGKTMERDIERHVRFSESHAHFTYNLQSTKFVEFIQTERFFVEICGKRDGALQPEIQPSLFGTEFNDKKISAKVTSTETLFKLQKLNETVMNEVEVLAVASYNLTPLLIPTWRVSSNEAMHNPDNIHYQKSTYSAFVVDDTFITANNINIKSLYREKCRSPLTELDLIESGTTLKMEFSFAAPICLVAHSVLAKAENLNRMFLVINNTEIAVSMLDFLLSNNQDIGYDKIAPNRHRIMDKSPAETDNYMTGFVIDNGNTYAFYIEGNIKRYMKPLWEKMMRSSPENVKIYYNDSTAFAKRQYSYFVKMGGFCIITMQRPLKDILAMEKIYIEGYVPLPCWQALKKLDLLFRSTTLKDMNQYNLFPSVDELLSFDLEFGSAVRWNERFSSVPNLPSIQSAQSVSFFASFED